MGWQDRDYAQQGQPRGFQTVFRPTSMSRFRTVSFILIAVNVVVHLVSFSVPDAYGAPILHEWGAMFTPFVLKGQVWRLITSEYLHANPMHLFVNMLGLYFLGPAIERTWGAKRFFIFYTISGFLGNVFFMGLNIIGFLEDGFAVGASGCILGLLGAAAVMFPHAEVLVYFLIPVKIRTAALVFGVWYAWNLINKGANAGGDACHLVGLVFGFWWARYGQHRWGWPKMPAGIPFKTVVRGQAGGFTQRVEQRRRDAATIDRILAKVSVSGMASLSDTERRALQEATERQRAEDRRVGLD